MAPTLEGTPAAREPNPSDRLKALIHAGSLLAGITKSRGDDASKTLLDVIVGRLHEFSNATTGITSLGLNPETIDGKDLRELESLTAKKSLDVLEHVQALLREYDEDLPADNKESNAPRVALGTRDLAVLRTLASVVFGWGTIPLLVALYPQVGSSAASISSLPSKSTLIEETKTLIVRLVALLWPSDVRPGTSAQSTRLFPSHITKILIASHATDMLRVGISIGWLPEQDEQVQQITLGLLKILPASQAIVSLGGVSQSMRSSHETGSAHLPTPVYVQKATSGLLSQQVLRPDGVSGLCAAVFGEGDEVAPLVKLERIARVLGAIPSQMDREAYMRKVLPNIIDLLSPAKPEFQSQSVPTSYKQAAAFTLSRMLTTSKSITLKIMSPIIHGRFFPEPTREIPSLSDTISTLTTLFTSTDPSPFLAQVIIEPILVSLYNLSAHLDAQRVSDPALKESVRGLIRTWARLVGREEAIEGLWSVIQGIGGWGVGGEAKWCWDVGEEGLEISRAGPPKPIPLSVLQGPDDNGELGGAEDDNPLSLRPVPAHFAELLKSLERKDVASALFVRTLNAYQASRTVETDPMKILLYLRLILEMQQKLGSSVLTEPEHILQFIAHVIEPKRVDEESESAAQDSLCIVEQEGDDENQAEEPQAQVEMTLTAVTLLLSILEANEKMSTLTSPLLAMVFDHLGPITNHEDESLRSLAREARLVLISRRSIAEIAPSTTDTQRSALQTYQEALRLIQDPILPVRAHGLHMLRQLVVPPKPAKGTPPTAPPELNPALVPGILDVFLQSIQEEDSFVFLNAVQGLSAMANRLGKEVIQNLVRIYADGVEPGRPMERAEVDKRVRVGEALVQVVRSCGGALGNYVDILVPPLFRVIRAHTLPTVLRSSALSILSQCVETYPVSVISWTDDILSGMLDILQLESVQAVPLSRKAREEMRNQEATKLDSAVDSRPQKIDSKLPPLRRSALHCFALIIRSMVEGVYEGTRPARLGSLRGKAVTVLDYLRITDSDPVVRTQAAETLSLVKQLGRAELGLEM